MRGIATVVVCWNRGAVVRTLPPRTLVTNLGKGIAIGSPGDSVAQMMMLRKTLTLLGLDAPIAPVML